MGVEKFLGPKEGGGFAQLIAFDLSSNRQTKPRTFMKGGTP